MKTKTHILLAIRSKLAESLIETIVAVTIIAIGATAAGVMIRTSMVGVELSQDRMLALNLAKEGIEGVRNIRDTNWLRYSSNKDECWNSDKFATDITDCDINTIDESYYSLIVDMTSLEYYLEDVGEADIAYDVSPDNDYQLYTCSIDAGTIYTNPSNVAGCDLIDFYRQIGITYESDDMMIVTSSVSWGDMDEGNTVTLIEYIGNW